MTLFRSLCSENDRGLSFTAESEGALRVHLRGLDFIRALAVFGVVVMHSNFGQRAPMTAAAQAFSNAFVFAVPFFLAASLYFRADGTKHSWCELRNRLRRVMIPYLIWSGIYLAAHLAKLLLLRQTAKIPGFISEIPKHFLCGSSAVHLYFLPLLAVGTLVAFFAHRQLVRVPFAVIVGALATTCAINWLLGPLVAPADASPFLQNAILNLANWTLRALPIAVGAVLIARLFSRARLALLPPWSIAVAGIGIVLAQFSHLRAIPPGTYDVWVGFSWFFLACALSRWLPPSPALDALGTVSGGIYLVHHLVVETIQTLLEKTVPAWTEVTTLLLLVAISVTAFLLSFLIVSLASRSPVTRRLFVI